MYLHVCECGTSALVKYKTENHLGRGCCFCGCRLGIIDFLCPAIFFLAFVHCFFLVELKDLFWICPASSMNLSIFQTLDKHAIYSIFFFLARVVLFFVFSVFSLRSRPFPSISLKEGRKKRDYASLNITTCSEEKLWSLAVNSDLTKGCVSYFSSGFNRVHLTPTAERGIMLGL